MRSISARILRRIFRELDLGSWRLAFEYFAHVLAGEREPELTYLREICPRRGAAIDVGANIGFYTFRMSRCFAHVYAFEPNAFVSSPIRAARLANVSLFDLGLSNLEETAELHIPVVGKVVLSGWASLKPGNCPDAERHLVRRVDLTTLDRFDLADVALIKIDVEGHEFEVLQGARATIEKSHPLLIVEIKASRFALVNALLSGYGYSRIPLPDIVGKAPGADNHVFQHTTQTDSVRSG
jgi:FkbM family methyltransferase